MYLLEGLIYQNADPAKRGEPPEPIRWPWDPSEEQRQQQALLPANELRERLEAFRARRAAEAGDSTTAPT